MYFNTSKLAVNHLENYRFFVKYLYLVVFSSTMVIILIGICQNFFVFVMFCGGGWKTSRKSYEVYMTGTRINNNTNVSNK